MTAYYTMESVRDLIIGRYDVRSSRENQIPIPSWNRYPSCPRIDSCRQEHCIGYISIFINTETIRWIQLEICFFRERQRAYIRIECLHMKKLLELGIINDNSKLVIETF